ncbi:MAG: GNAT family N-acetyltransferase [Planctomycetes bacterium]|nr:GNAT family N-acetyltransferase [Planctomycetota bacterium]
MNFQISTEKALLDVDAIFAFLSTCYWSPGIARARVERAIENSMCFGVYEIGKVIDGGSEASRTHPQPPPTGRGLRKQVGFARVITDKATYGYIADVFVLEEYRGRGLSKMLMKAIVEHPELQGMRRLCLMTRDAQGLYAQFGFAATPDPARYMEVVDRESYKRD